jgi:hypothetical protein
MPDIRTTSNSNKQVQIENPQGFAARLWFKEELENANSRQQNCRWYVKGVKYGNPTTTSTNSPKGLRPYILSPLNNQTTHIRIYVHQEEKNDPVETTITVRKTTNQELLQAVVNLGNDAAAKPLHTARGDARDAGKMIPFGEKPDGSRPAIYTATTKLDQSTLLEACQQASLEFSKHFPIASSEIRNAIQKPPIEELGGHSCISHMALISIDLANADHTDTRDASYSCAVWASNDPKNIENWYFLCPNIAIDHDGILYQGLLVALDHGVEISWDGRVIRHCTSLTTRNTKKAHAYSFFMAANGPLAHIYKQMTTSN